MLLFRISPSVDFTKEDIINYGFKLVFKGYRN